MQCLLVWHENGHISMKSHWPTRSIWTKSHRFQNPLELIKSLSIPPNTQQNIIGTCTCYHLRIVVNLSLAFTDLRVARFRDNWLTAVGSFLLCLCFPPIPKLPISLPFFLRLWGRSQCRVTQGIYVYSRTKITVVPGCTKHTHTHS